MIERLLVAQAALDRGQLDTAGRLFDQVAQADPQNVIAIVGLAQIALREDRFEEARALAEQALAIDPAEAAAQRVLREAYAEQRPAPEPAVPMPPVKHGRKTAEPRRPSLVERIRRFLFGRRRG
jgi:predicted Zn-dependent protease